MSDTEDIMGLLNEHHSAQPEKESPTRVRNGEFYHGTGRELSPGDQVLPWSRMREMGLVEGEAAHGGSHTAWAHEDPEGAAAYGPNVYRVTGDGERLGDGRVRSREGFTVRGKHE